MTEEIIVLQEEEELEREKQREERLTSLEDVIPGEEGSENETGLAAKKSMASIKSVSY